MSHFDAVELAKALIAVPSITPARGEVFDVLCDVLEELGFTCHRWVMGEEPDGPTENLVAIRGNSGPHLGFAGHLDVVPPGKGWDHDPFEPQIKDGILSGRGACDMKSAIACFVSALEEHGDTPGTVSLLITGDEEGYATWGTPRIIDWLNEKKIKPDMILIGEPTSVDKLGDTVKVGRRGSLNLWIEAPGHQGHVAYPHMAHNPVPDMAKIITALEEWHLDDGTDAFQPSNLEFTALSTPTDASNVIPGTANAQLNIRFNDTHSGASLIADVERIVAEACPEAVVKSRISGESFLTPPGPLYDMLVESIREETGIDTDLSTSGGTSDGRFLHVLCPVVDFGLPNASMHKIGEHARVEDIQALKRIYGRVIGKFFAAQA